MIIDNFYIDRPGRSVWPLKANPPLIINANAILAFPVAFEGFETITGYLQIAEGSCCFKSVEFHLRFVLKPREGFNPLPLCKLARSFISEADDHCYILLSVMHYVKHNLYPCPKLSLFSTSFTFIPFSHTGL